jgi:hypothetical protein
MNYTWNIVNLKRTISDDVVNEIQYQCIAESASYSERQISSLEITGSSEDPGFIPYEDLTEGIVLAWVTGSIDKTSFELEVSSSLASQVNDVNSEDYGLPF